MIERTSARVKMHDVDPTALRDLIEYMYTGEILITEDNVQVSVIRIFHDIHNGVFITPLTESIWPNI